jgi:hypothetical protein
MHDLVVRERQDEIFREGIVQAEQDFVVVKFSMHWILADIAQRVVHPAHVPFVTEAQSAMLDRARHLRPGRGFFGGRRGLWKAREHLGVEAMHESDRVEIFAPAKFVGNPATCGAAVIEVKHGGDCIDPQAVDTVTLQPE